MDWSWKKRILLIVFILALVTTLTCEAFAKQKLITMGTAGRGGVYFPTGVAMANLFHVNRAEHKMRVAVEVTSGSRININSVLEGELDFGFVQADLHYQAAKGLASFKGRGPAKKLRSVFSLAPEAFYLITRPDTGIKNYSDIKNRKVNLGKRGSGHTETFLNLLKSTGVDKKTAFAETKKVKAKEQWGLLCAKAVDVVPYIVAAPSASIEEVSKKCPISFVTVVDSDIQSIVSRAPYYFPSSIPGGMYDGNPNETRTFGMRSTLVTRDDVPTDIVYLLVKTVFENFEEFKKSHPALAGLDKTVMIKYGITAPLHPGAIKYFKEAGLM